MPKVLHVCLWWSTLFTYATKFSQKCDIRLLSNNYCATHFLENCHAIGCLVDLTMTDKVQHLIRGVVSMLVNKFMMLHPQKMFILPNFSNMPLTPIIALSQFNNSMMNATLILLTIPNIFHYFQFLSSIASSIFALTLSNHPCKSPLPYFGPQAPLGCQIPHYASTPLATQAITHKKWPQEVAVPTL